PAERWCGRSAGPVVAERPPGSKFWATRARNHPPQFAFFGRGFCMGLFVTRGTGDRCEACGIGWPVAYKTKRIGAALVRYSRCVLCGKTSKAVLPLADLHARLSPRKSRKLVLAPLALCRGRTMIGVT